MDFLPNEVEFKKLADDYVRFSLELHIPCFKLGFINEFHSPVFDVIFSNQSVDLKAGNKTKLNFKIRQFSIEDKWTGASAFPFTIQTRQLDESGQVLDEARIAESERKEALHVIFD